MKLLRSGHVSSLGGYAEIRGDYDNLNAILGLEMFQGIPDLSFKLEEIGPDYVRFTMTYGFIPEPVTLKLGETYEHARSGNAYSHRLTLTLED